MTISHGKTLKDIKANMVADVNWLALGENCMPINVLRRHGKTAPSTPFSAGRSDIEHIEYQSFLEPSYLTKVNAFTSESYINLAKKSTGKCKPGRHLYLELTHHNPFIHEDNLILKRRIQRMLRARNDNSHNFLFYHHRSTKGFLKTRAHIKKHMIAILNRYSKNTTAICYSQEIVSTKENRGINLRICAGGKIHFCTLKTLAPWAGKELDIFFGRTDDDLFVKLFEHCKRFEDIQLI